MRVLYDIGILGLGYGYPKTRTGIFRVAEHIAAGISCSPAVQLSYFASDNEYDAQAYVEKSGIVRSGPVYLRHKKTPLRIYQEQVEKREAQISNAISHAKMGRIPLKALRYGLYKYRTVALPKLYPFLQSDSEEPLSAAAFGRVLDGQEIYHSPMQPFPEEVQKHRSLRKILTVYDLIPIIHPQFLPGVTDDIWTVKAIKSMDKDSWAIAISESTRNDLCNYYPHIDPAKVQVTHLAAAPEVFYPCVNRGVQRQARRKYAIPEAPYFLGLSTLAPNKNFEHVIRCFFRLVASASVPDLHLIVVGNKGWDYDGIFKTIRIDPKLKKRIVIVGRVADEDLSAIYSGALGFLYMSFYEGFGLPPLEAMQCGVPVVTSDTSSLPEVVGGAGIMLGPTDADGLCQAMLRLYGDSGLRAEMSQKSLARAANFSWEKTVQQTIQVYKKSLND